MLNTAEATTGIIPDRHGANREQAKNLLGIINKVLPNWEPSPERWQAMGEALMQGDEPVDRLVEWMFLQGMSQTRPQFEQALEHGLASLPNAPAPLRTFFEQIETPPAWLDVEKLERGARVHHRAGTDGIDMGRDVALVGGYQASAFNKTLLLTGALKKGPSRRFAETLQWALDCTGAGGMQRDGVGFKSTIRVRLIHGLVRRHVRQLPEWRMQEWGLPINQTDMSATLLGTLVVPMLCTQILGLIITPSEREALVHHARYVGWLMGVEDHWLPKSHAEALSMLYQLMLSISNPDETSAQLAQPMLDDPLLKSTGRLGPLREALERSRHLSISRAFLGREGMRNLGLPTSTWPWYPAVALPRNLIRSLASYALPGGVQRQARRGRAAQEAYLARMSGTQGVKIGQSAPKYA